MINVMSIADSSNRVGSTPKKETTVCTENIAWYRNQAENWTVDSTSMYRHLHHYLNTRLRKNLKSFISGTWWCRRWLSLKRRLIWNVTETVSETSVDVKHDGDGIWNVGWLKHDGDGIWNVGWLKHDGDGLWNVGWYETWWRRYLKRRLIWNVTETVSETSVDMKRDGDGLWNFGWYETWRRRSLKRRLMWNMTETVSETSVDVKRDGDGLWNVGWFETPDAAVSPGIF